MVPFILFEGGYKSTSELFLNNTSLNLSEISDSDLFYLPSGDFIDENRIEEYYSNPDDQNDNSAKSAAE